jgi:hypothetical protein
VFDEEAGVFDDGEASDAGFFGGSGVRDALLEPEDFGADGDGGIGDGRYALRTAKDVDDVDGLGDVFEAGIGCLAEHFAFVGIDGDDAIADRLEIGGDFVRGAVGIRGETDDGDGFGLAEDLRDGVRGSGIVVGEMEEHGCSMKKRGKRIEEIGIWEQGEEWKS